MRRLGLLLVAALVMGCETPIMPVSGGPSAVVRQAFERLAAHDLAGLGALACPGQRDPTGRAFSVPGITSPFASVPTGTYAETLALIDIDVSGVRVESVDADGGTVLVPVSGDVVLRVDPVGAEAMIRAASAIDPLPPTEAEIQAALDAIRAGPTILDVGNEMETVQVTKVGEAWLICPNPPSPAPSG